MILLEENISKLKNRKQIVYFSSSDLMFFQKRFLLTKDYDFDFLHRQKVETQNNQIDPNYIFSVTYSLKSIIIDLFVPFVFESASEVLIIYDFIEIGSYEKIEKLFKTLKFCQFNKFFFISSSLELFCDAYSKFF